MVKIFLVAKMSEIEEVDLLYSWNVYGGCILFLFGHLSNKSV